MNFIKNFTKLFFPHCFPLYGGSGGGKAPKSTTQTVITEPWRGAKPYLVGNKKTTGIFPEAMGLYNTNKWSQGMKNENADYQAMVNGRQQDPFLDIFNDQAQNMALGGMSPGIKDVKSINAPSIANFGQQMGAADPTAALQRAMSGQIDTQWLDKQSNAITNLATSNMLKNVMPNIDSNAFAAGGYGGSRQGIAQGNAISDLNNQLGSSITGMYSNAYQNAQNMAQNTAMNLTNQGLQQQADTAQFNANLGFQNNQQKMAAAQQDAATRMQGLNALQTGYNMQNTNYADIMSALQQKGNYNWDNLNKYAALITPGAGMGSSSTSSSQMPNYNNTMGQVIGGVGAMGSLLSNFR